MRARLLAVAAALAALLPAAASAAQSSSAEPLPSFERALVGEINALRVRHGLPRLAPAPRLKSQARAHAGDMLARGYFGHDGLARRLAGYSRVGENIAWQRGLPAPSRILRLWLASPPHREQLLARKWRLIGLGAVHGTARGGVYGHGPVTVVVADFGTP